MKTNLVPFTMGMIEMEPPLALVFEQVALMAAEESGATNSRHFDEGWDLPILNRILCRPDRKSAGRGFGPAAFGLLTPVHGRPILFR